jgi:uncharacterized protein
MLNIKRFVILLLLSTSQVAWAEAVNNIQGHILHPKGLLWKIDKTGQKTSYLYGTMHVGDPRVVNLAPEVEVAFRNADRFAMEMLLNFRAQAIIFSGSFFNDGRTLRTVMQPDKYKKLLALLNRRFFVPESLIVNMRPWAVLVMLMIPEEARSNIESTVDMVLYRRAAMRKIPLLGLETAEEQLAVFESLTIEEQLWMLNKSVEEYNKISDQMPSMLNTYVNRDLEGLVRLQEKYMYDDSDIDDRFMHSLIDKRNIRMVDRMQGYLKQGNAFIAIGALHLPGKNGVLHLLEQQGYVVKSIY